MSELTSFQLQSRLSVLHFSESVGFLYHLTKINITNFYLSVCAFWKYRGLVLYIMYVYLLFSLGYIIIMFYI